MKIAVTARGTDLNSQVDSRFGRSAAFVIVEPDTMECEGIENASAGAGGGAGIQSGQLMADRGVTVVLTGNCGPNAFRTLEAAGIQVVTGASGTVKEAVELYKSGNLAATTGPSVGDRAGMR